MREKIDPRVAAAPGFFCGPFMTAMPTNIPCPRCGKESPWEGNPHRPFCSERCRLIDLGAWAGEEYRIPGGRKPTEEDDGGNGGR